MLRRNVAPGQAEAEPPLAAAARDLELAARCSANVLVTSRDGRDRAACARAIHDCGSSRHRPFVALRGDLSLLAAGDLDRSMDQAAGGTLFIDDIGALMPHLQDRLVLLTTEQSRYTGGNGGLSADDRVRIVAGSDRSLRADVAIGAFSDVLFYRLNAIHIDLLQPRPGGDPMKARDILSAPVRTCRPETDLATVARIMWDHDCGFVPVVDASGAVVGTVTDRDICIASSTRRLLPEQMAASQVMTTPVHAALADDSIGDVLATMKQFRVRRVPVIDVDGALLGVISINDIVRASNERREPPTPDVVATLAVICAHRRFTAMGR